jgi:hypothetical protein
MGKEELNFLSKPQGKKRGKKGKKEGEIKREKSKACPK